MIKLRKSRPEDITDLGKKKTLPVSTHSIHHWETTGKEKRCAPSS